MPIIKNIGKRDRMVADRILRPGDAKFITQKQAEQFDGIPDFEIVDETPIRTKVEVAPVSDASTAAVSGLDTPMSTSATRPAKVSKRGKKK